jgi:hypothetical protein
MPKQKKKRNKAYTGAGASLSRPTITRVNAVKRNGLQRWWFDNKRLARPVLIAAGVIIVAVWLLVELFRVISGSGT